MSGRPEILYPLFAGVDSLPGIGKRTARLFARLGVETVGDMALTLPSSGIARRPVASLREAEPGADVVVEVAIGRHRPAPRRGAPHIVEVQDSALTFELVFFHAGREHLQRSLPTGQRRVIAGRYELYDGRARIAHPDHVLRPGAEAPLFEPTYPATEGLGQRQIAKAAEAALARAPELPEWIDPALTAREGWPPWRAALTAAHGPATAGEMSPQAPARARLAYDELLAHQLTLGLARAARRRQAGRASAGDGALRARLMAALPYAPTAAQTRTMDEIAADMAAPERMHRLLQGDVGAGKTLVAFAALLIAVEAGGQGALMAPTEILARQHLDSLTPLAEATGVRLILLTGRDTGAARAGKLARIAGGAADIAIGTHALFQSDVAFGDLRLVVADEQHRFGVAQRLALAEKGARPDTLVMTATPIPRSLALAQYGDMDVSTLDEKPPGRRPVHTALVSAGRLDEVIAHLETATRAGRQCYWVCPLVEESERVPLTAAEARAEVLRRRLGAERVGLVHGQMPPAERDAVMARFAAGDLPVLVATTVIEVGVDVPGATIMVIERAESFGLAQLHQLRGRVGRGDAASTCLLIHEPPLSEPARRRLAIMRETEDGFRIAEEDLALRGAGDVIGTAQSGLPRFRIADVERQAGLMATARQDARALLDADPALEGPRGQAARLLLWLMRQDRAIRLIRVG